MVVSSCADAAGGPSTSLSAEGRERGSTARSALLHWLHRKLRPHAARILRAELRDLAVASVAVAAGAVWSAPRRSADRRRGTSELGDGFDLARLAALDAVVNDAIAAGQLPGAVVARRPRRHGRVPQGLRPARDRPGAGADDARHDLRPGVADQGRGDDDGRDDAGRRRPDPADRSGRARSFPSSASTARTASPFATC